MGRGLQRASFASLLLGILLTCGRVGFGSDSDAVHVKYEKGEVDVATLSAGVKCVTDHDYTLQQFPAELNGLKFTRQRWSPKAHVEIDISAGSTVYLIMANGPGAAESRKEVTAAGWSKLGDANIKESNTSSAVFWVYKQAVTHPLHATIEGGGLLGVMVAAKDLSLSPSEHPAEKKPIDGTPPLTLHVDRAPSDKPTAGSTVQLVNQLASIRALEIYQTDSGLMLGKTSEVVLTAARGKSSRPIEVRFVTPVGDDTSLARDEALRFIHLTYPNWYADKAEVSFEDKYVPHDGGSIGAAIGTLTLSVIQGFQIDPNIAITGDISANGKIRAIGGLSAKLRGAVAGKCTLAAIPTENYDQLVDAVTYSGVGAASDVQVLGISTLDDAIATVRTDRGRNLSEAIAIFGTVQVGLQRNADYLKTGNAADRLTKVLELAPQHLSASVLLTIAQGRQPKTLSATASRYYTFLAAKSMIDILKEREAANNPHQLSSGVIRDGLADLRKLRPKADVKVRPLVDAWITFISAWSELQQGQARTQTVETQRQALLDEMSKEQADPQLMQKMLKEGM